MLKGDIVVVDFDKDFPFHMYIEKQINSLNEVKNGIHKNLWTIEFITEPYIAGTNHHDLHISHVFGLKNLDSGFSIHIPLKFIMTMDMFRDKKIDKLLC